MPPYRIGSVFLLIKFICNPGNTHLFVVMFLRGRERDVCCWPQSPGGHVSGEGPGDEMTCRSTFHRFVNVVLSVVL